MSKLYCDLESFCPTPIKFGAHRYSEDAEILLFPYAWGDEEPKVLDFTQPGFNFRATELYDMLHDPEVMTVWHNGSMFDRVVLKNVLGIDIPTNRLTDTMVQAYMHGLPGSLDKLCEIFQLDEETAKSKEGKRLIQLFCKPRPKNMALRRATRETHPEEWVNFVDYAYRDILSMRKLHGMIPKWNMKHTAEMQLFELDQRINARGFKVDLDLATAAIATVEKAKEELNEAVNDLTGGKVTSATQRAALLSYIQNDIGENIPNLQSATIDKWCASPQVDEDTKTLLRARQVVGGTAVKKYQVLLDATNSDGRLRGTLQFCGASRTGRWSGRIFQPQNLPRPSLKQPDIDFGIKAMKAGCADLVVDDVVALATSAIRGCIVAPEGKKLCVSDLSNIEGRGAAWLAREEWKLTAFREFDAGVGHDLYTLAYANAFGVDPEVVVDNTKNGDGSMRQIGKVLELALAYEGGVGAFVTFADVYRVNLRDLSAKVYHQIPNHIKMQANKAWGWALSKNKTLDLSEREFVTCDSLKRMWREAHPATVAYWHMLEEAAISAVKCPGEVFTANAIKFYRSGSWLRMVLPSGRQLVYAHPTVEKGKLHYWGIDQTTRRWVKMSTHGGKLLENGSQAMSRDIMGYNLPSIEAAGYLILLTVHDETITETPDTDEFTGQGLSTLLATQPPYAPDLPLAAQGYETYRYRKD